MRLRTLSHCTGQKVQLDSQGSLLAKPQQQKHPAPWMQEMMCYKLEHQT